MAVPVEGAQELLVVRALLVPVRQQARRDVQPLAVPALRDHVDLAAGMLLIALLRVFRIGDIEVMRGAVHEGIDPQTPAIGGNGDINGQRNLRRITNRSDLPGSPRTALPLLDEP